VARAVNRIAKMILLCQSGARMLASPFPARPGRASTPIAGASMVIPGAAEAAMTGRFRMAALPQAACLRMAGGLPVRSQTPSESDDDYLQTVRTTEHGRPNL
jgi:hypothetical protein